MSSPAHSSAASAPGSQASVAAMAPAAPVVLVLASGRGERFKAAGGAGHKLQALLAGKPVLEHTLNAVRASGLPWRLEIAPHPGMGDSIAAAVRATSKASAWLVLPGDLPLIQAGSLLAVAAALASHTVVVPSYKGEKGHPVGFSAVCGPALQALSGERGAASVVKAHAAFELSLDDMGCVRDVDTPEQLAQMERLYKALPRAS